MAHKIDRKVCVRCGICVSKCPENAIIDSVSYHDGLIVHNTRVAVNKCNDCGVCEQADDAAYFCPVEAFVKA